MKSLNVPSGRLSSHLVFGFMIALAGLTTSCTSANMKPLQSPFSGNTNVTLLLTSTANDQLVQFDIDFTGITLTSKSGKTATLLNTNVNPEFIHLNGKLEPLLTVSVPQGLYTSATVTVGNNLFTCVALNPSSQGLVIAEFSENINPPVVNVPMPITVNGSAIGLVLNLNVTQSATVSNCGGDATFAITPTFDLTALRLETQSNRLNETAMNGEISAVNAGANNFTVTLAGGQMDPAIPSTANGQTVLVNTNSSTVYHGIGGLSALTAGMFVNFDASIQTDGSQLATRVEVEDANPANLTVSTGAVMQVYASESVMFALSRQDQGFLWTSHLGGGYMPYSFGSAVFQISGAMANLQNLPFVPVFDASHMFDGQGVYVTTHAVTLSQGPTYFPATTITLIPQTIDGTVTSSSSAGGFTTYTVTLASYDPIPNLAVQPRQTTILTSPNQVVVYVDSNTQMLNSIALAPGNTLRFEGLLFDDNGTLRMDCGQVSDGVAQ